MLDLGRWDPSLMLAGLTHHATFLTAVPVVWNDA